MKSKFAYQLFLMFAIVLGSCGNDDDAPKMMPEVKTSVPSNISTKSATVGGTIINDGNDAILKSGVTYSSNVAMPTTADNMLEATVPSGDFSSTIQNLASGTIYHVRAFATNSVGTAYGEVIDFTTDNNAPVVSNIVIEGALEVNKEITAKYTYEDAENDPEGESNFHWYVASNAAGDGETLIAGATTKAFLVKEDQNAKFIRVSVTPKATGGTINGVEVKSSYIGAVGEATTVTFIYNNESVTYGIIPSATGKRWMDRNLGATRLAQSVDDYLAYGDMFQWGRAADGHQRVTRTGKGDSDVHGVTGVTSTTEPFDTSNDNTPETDKFIVDGSLLADWRQPQENNLWQGVDGINNPCPAGWRIPTIDEWIAEGITSGPDGFTKLKLTYSGIRANATGDVGYTSLGRYWSSTIRERPSALYTRYFGIDETTVVMGSFNYYARANGIPCRCIKN